jgi:hypothetical protein
MVDAITVGAYVRRRDHTEDRKPEGTQERGQAYGFCNNPLVKTNRISQELHQFFLRPES